mgnify:CR=1 FL=1
MLKMVRIALVSLGLAITGGAAEAATAEQEQTFLDTYKTAFEAEDAETLRGLLHTDGAEPMAVEFYAEMMVADFGGKITNIGLRAMTPDEEAEAASELDGPTGGKFVLLPKPYKKFFVEIEITDANGSSKGTSEAYVAEVDGRIVIATPAPVK